jgi:autotransporter-associated beta strand protein
MPVAIQEKTPKDLQLPMTDSSSRSDGFCPILSPASAFGVRVTGLLVMSLLTGPLAWAGNSWTGASSQDWNTASNWGGDFPTTTAGVSISTANYPVISADPLFTTNGIFVGATAVARLDHVAGVAATTSSSLLTVARGTGSVGIYNLADTTGTGGKYTGYATGSGSMYVGGTTTGLGTMRVGFQQNAVGTVNMNTTGIVRLRGNQAFLLGVTGTASGAFNMDAGTLEITSEPHLCAMLVGHNGGDGAFRMSGGTVNVTGGIFLGDYNAASSGVMEISGGTFNLTCASALGSTGEGQVCIGRDTAQGSMTVSGTATVNLTGGACVASSLVASPPTSGTLTVSGGSFTTTGTLQVGSGRTGGGSPYPAYAGTGVFNLSGGTATVTGNLQLASGYDKDDVVTGTLNASGGTLNVGDDFIISYAGSSNLGEAILTGATVNAGTNGKRSVYVNRWDTTRGQLTVSAGTLNLLNDSLLRFSGGGSTGVSSATLSGTGAITGGGGSALDLMMSPVAGNNTFHLDGGVLTIGQVISTSNTGTAVFKFNGGTLKAADNNANFLTLGAATHAAVIEAGGAVIDSNGREVVIAESLLAGSGGGGLTKLGAGTLTLAGTGDSYTGPTTVSAGTLVITGNHAAATGEVVVEAGGALSLTGDANLGGGLKVKAGGSQLLAVAATPGSQVPRTVAGALIHETGSTLVLQASSQPADGVYLLESAAGGVTFDGAVNFIGIIGGSVSTSGNDLVLTVAYQESGYANWCESMGLTAGVNDGAGDNPDADGFDNATEYLLGGHPNDGASQPKIHALMADRGEAGAAKEFILTIAVPQGTPVFPPGTPISAVSFGGFGIQVRGSTDLANPTSTVTPIDPEITGLPAAPVQGGVNYEYRSFRLEGSDGIAGKGFLQVIVSHP